MDDDAEARRRARASWPVRKYRLGEEPDDDISDVTTPEQRVFVIWRLTRTMWSLAGRSMPSYDRASTPARLVRRGSRS